MKKFLLLICTLLVGVGGVKANETSITDGGLYTIQFKKNSWYFSPTLKTSQSNAGTFRFDVAGTGLYNIYSVEVGKYLTRPDSPANGGTPSLSETLEDTDNFKWVVAYDGSDWRIKTSNEVFCLNGWTNTFAETNDVKFYNDATHDLAPLVISKAPTAEQKAAKEKADAWTELITNTSTGLLSSSNQWVSLAADASEGWLDRLTDGDLTNYFHSDWHGAFSGTHYIEATLPEATNSLHLYYYTRSTGTGCPTNITVSASTDGETWVDNVATINESDMPKAASKPYLSKGLTFDASYSHFRFYVPSTNSGTNSWFCLAEANLYAATSATAEAMTLAHVEAAELTAEQIARINALDTELRSTTVNVTYELYESDGTTLIASEVVIQDKNSEISVPTALTSNIYYNYSTEGTIGTDDCTIKVIRTLKAGIVYPISNLSNYKAYTLTTARGTLGTNGIQMVSTNGTTFSASNFAIINYEERYYLYSVADSKFVSHNTQPTLTDDIGEVSPITLELTDVPYYFMKMGNNGVNVATGYGTGIVINNWVTQDPGNQYVIEEANDFDPTEALAALEAFFHPSNYYDRVEAEVVPFLMDAEGHLSPTIGKPFGLSTDAATNIVQTYQQQLNAGTFNQEEYEGIVALKEAGIVYPEDGKYYVIKSVSNGKYINVQSASGIYANATSPVAGSIVKAVVRDGHMYFATQGKEFGWCYYANSKALLDAAGGGKYVYWSDITTPGQIAFAHCLGNGQIIDGTDYSAYLPGSYYTVGENEQVCGGTASAAAAQWTFEEASSFDIALNGPIDGSYYATLCVPFDITLDGATAYTIANGEGSELTMTPVEGTVAAGTPVVLVGTSASATATIGTNYSANISSETALTGSYLEIASFNGATNYVLGTDGTKAGFFHWDGTTLKSNRAYIAGEAAGIKGFYLNFGDTDGVKNVDLNVNLSDKVYDLSGRRVNQPTRGLYIVNGKKVAVK
ncbi:MAG: RICIN domain-containing protein [Bacteroidaceae bacterium]|nr:RICIN domain-containing protein [Bacteroidaceae bacterium]